MEGVYCFFNPQRRAELKADYLVGYLGGLVSLIVYAKLTEQCHSEIATAITLGFLGTTQRNKAQQQI